MRRSAILNQAVNRAGAVAFWSHSGIGVLVDLATTRVCTSIDENLGDIQIG